MFGGGARGRSVALRVPSQSSVYEEGLRMIRLLFFALLATPAVGQATVLGAASAGEARGDVATASSPAIEEVKTLALERSRALVGRDLATLDRILAPEFVYTNASGDFADKQTYLARVSSPRVAWISQELRDVEVRVVGDTAVLTAEVHDRATYEGQPLDATFRSTFVYVRSAAGWRCVAGHTSPVAADP
jgi:ketosteroid isomerase-like protein